MKPVWDADIAAILDELPAGEREAVLAAVDAACRDWAAASAALPRLPRLPPREGEDAYMLRAGEWVVLFAPDADGNLEIVEVVGADHVAALASLARKP